MKRNSTFVSKAVLAVIIISLNFFAAKSQNSVNTPGYYQHTSLSTNASPVKYVSFNSYTTEKSVFLDWVTTNEVNSSHYEVERSFDSSNFKTIGLVLGALTVNGDNNSYKFKHSSSDLKGIGNAYYRLKMISMDGTSTYSNVIMVSLKAE